MATQTESTAADPTRPAVLGVWDAIAIIVGIIIGSSIFRLPPDIFGLSGGPWEALGVWALVGFLALVGALCYAELTTTYSHSAGGDYTYLTRAYGRSMGFMFAWAELALIRTGGSIAFMAYVFAEYFRQIYDPEPTLGAYTMFVLTSAGILALAVVNLMGVKPGKFTQNVLAAAKVLGLLGIVAVGVGWYVYARLGHAPVPELSGGGGPPPGMTQVQALALAMVLVFYAYGGWNDTAFVAAEVRDPRRNLVRALILGTLAVTAIYLLVNLAYLLALGYDGASGSKAIAGDVLALPFGQEGRAVMAVLVMISALGAINGMMFTGMRLYGTFGQDHKLFSWLADRQGRPQGSAGAVLAQAGFSMLLIAVIESAPYWRGALARVAPSLGVEVDSGFVLTGSIERLVMAVAPIFWFFFLLSGISLFVLRVREPERERPFRVPLFPLTPLVFCATSAFMLYRSLDYALDQQPAEALVVIALVLMGLPLLFLSKRAGQPGRAPGPDV